MEASLGAPVDMENLDTELTWDEAQSRVGQLMAGRVLLGAYISDRAAAKAKLSFDRIQFLSGLTPTQALIILDCLDAQLAVSEGRGVDVRSLIQRYFAADNGEYISRNMLGALKKFESMLSELDEQLAEVGVPDDQRPRWVRAGLDHPSPGDGAAHHITRTHIEHREWEIARERLAEYATYVARLPHRIRRGEVDLDAVEEAMVDAIVASPAAR